MRRKPWLTALLVAAACAHDGRSVGTVELGDTFRFRLADGIGNWVDSRDLNDRVLLVEFWASWCAPCLRSLPSHADLYARMSDLGLRVVAISVDAQRSDMLAFVRERPLPFPVLHDPEGQLLRRLGASSVPYIVLLDDRGRLVFRNEGFGPGSALEVERAVRYVLDIEHPG